MALYTDTIDLIIFGDFGVLTNTPFKDHQPLHMLPGRAEYLKMLQDDRYERGVTPLRYTITGNKGGVAWGVQTEDQAREELRQTAEWIGATTYKVCFACPTCKAGYEQYTTKEMLRRRKPQHAMFQEVIEELGVAPARVLIVDHYADGMAAAKALGTGWQAPGTFFAQAERFAPKREEEVPEEVAAALDALDLFDIDAALDTLED